MAWVDAVAISDCVDTWRVISRIEADSSSVAAATVLTLALASVAAAATFCTCSADSVDSLVSDSAV